MPNPILQFLGLQPRMLSPLPDKPKILSPLPDNTQPQIQQTPQIQQVQPEVNPFASFTRGNIAPEMSTLILDAAKKYNVDPVIMAAMLFQESGIDPRVKDNIGVNEQGVKSRDRGVAQINSVAHPEVTDEQAYDPSFAIPFLASELAKSSKRFNGDLSQAIASYNVGVGGVANNMGQNTAFGGGPKGQAYIDAVSQNIAQEALKRYGIKTSK